MGGKIDSSALASTTHGTEQALNGAPRRVTRVRTGRSFLGGTNRGVISGTLSRGAIVTKRLDRNLRRTIGCVTRVRNARLNGICLKLRDSSTFSSELRGCVEDKNL